jgi:peptidoglycan/LPS O-acetylase OafA/YrhL
MRGFFWEKKGDQQNNLMNYRAEIDGLRAIAVLSVILYHAKFMIFGRGDWFQGGFIGVDVFFVISGYFITRIILSELFDKSNFSFLKFYERRARRILPMLFTVMLVSFPFAWLRLLPTHFIEYSKSILSAVFFSANFFFYYKTTEYGADSALLKPFLGTWTLGVEEQFYIVFPVLLIVFHKFLKNHLLTLFLAMLLFSLEFSNAMSIFNPKLNFYLLFSRFWELLVGSVLAYIELKYGRIKNEFLSRILPIVGLYLITDAIVFFDDKMPHPSFKTLLPIVGVGLIIAFASKEDFVGKVLGSRPFVGVGLISYSAYLWHFPIFALSRVSLNNPSNHDKIGWIGLTFLLSVISYHLIEKPARRTISLKSLGLILLIILTTLVSLCGTVIYFNGFESRLKFDFSSLDRPPIDCQKHKLGKFNEYVWPSAPPNNVDGQWCFIGKEVDENIDFVVIGDSHALSSKKGFDIIGKELGLRGVIGWTSGCPPLLGTLTFRGNPHPNPQSKACLHLNQIALDLAKEKKAKFIFLISRWDYYLDGTNNAEDVNYITPIDGTKTDDLASSRLTFENGVIQTINSYKILDANLFVILQVPHQNIDSHRILEEMLSVSGLQDITEIQSNANKNKSIGLVEHYSRQKMANGYWFKHLERIENNNIEIFDPAKILCDVNCPLIVNGKFVYFDDDHLSKYGFSLLHSQIKEMFRSKM